MNIDSIICYEEGKEAIRTIVYIEGSATRNFRRRDSESLGILA